jgi:glycosyltransferase involved in cell wall biosynthesis
MKILYLSNGYPPHRWAGTERYTAGLARGFQCRGHRVEVLCAGEWDTGPKYWNGFSDEDSAEVLVRRINVNWKKAPDPFRYLYNNPVVAQFLEAQLERFKPDLVHVTSCETLSASILEVVHRSHLPLVLSITDYWFLCPRINLLRRDESNCTGLVSAWDCLGCQLHEAKIYRWSRRLLSENLVAPLIASISRYSLLTRQRGLRGMAGEIEKRRSFLQNAVALPNCRITASQYVREVYDANGITAPIRVQAYGHDLGWLRHYHGKSASDKIRLGYIGQILPSKGVHVLLEAVRSLEADIGEKVELSIYGDLRKQPEYGARLLSVGQKMKGVRFPGIYDPELSAKVFSEIDVLVVPSLWLDFPLIIHEAFATSTPVIVSNLGSMTDSVDHGVNGLCFKAGDSADLARQIHRVVEENGLLGKLRAGSPVVKTIGEELDEFEILYGDLLSI